MKLDLNSLKAIPKFVLAGFVAFAFLSSNHTSAEDLDQRIDFVMSALSTDEGKWAKIDFSVRFNGSTLCEYTRQFRGVDLLPDACKDLSEKELRSMRASKVCDYGGGQDMAACFRRLSGLEFAAAEATNRFIQSQGSTPELDKAGRLYQEYVSLVCELDASVNGGEGVYESLALSSCKEYMYAKHRYALSDIAWAYQR